MVIDATDKKADEIINTLYNEQKKPLVKKIPKEKRSKKSYLFNIPSLAFFSFITMIYYSGMNSIYLKSHNIPDTGPASVYASAALFCFIVCLLSFGYVIGNYNGKKRGL